MQRRLVAWGLALVIGMQGFFVFTGGDRGAVYVLVNLLALLATVVAAWGLARPERRGALFAAAASFAALGVLRALNVVLNLTRVALPLSVLMLLGWGLAAWGALAWGRRPASFGATLVRAALWILAFAYFAAVQGALASGRLSTVVALLVGTVGFTLAAPNVEAVDPPARINAPSSG